MKKVIIVMLLLASSGAVGQESKSFYYDVEKIIDGRELSFSDRLIRFTHTSGSIKLF